MTNWERIVREHGGMVFGTAWRVLGHAADCEDVVQEVFLEAHKLQQSQPVRNWPGLLRKLATYRALAQSLVRLGKIDLMVELAEMAAALALRVHDDHFAALARVHQEMLAVWRELA